MKMSALSGPKQCRACGTIGSNHSACFGEGQGYVNAHALTVRFAESVADVVASHNVSVVIFIHDGGGRSYGNQESGAWNITRESLRPAEKKGLRVFEVDADVMPTFVYAFNEMEIGVRLPPITTLPMTLVIAANGHRVENISSQIHYDVFGYLNRVMSVLGTHYAVPPGDARTGSETFENVSTPNATSHGGGAPSPLLLLTDAPAADTEGAPEDEDDAPPEAAPPADIEDGAGVGDDIPAPDPLTYIQEERTAAPPPAVRKPVPRKPPPVEESRPTIMHISLSKDALQSQANEATGKIAELLNCLLTGERATALILFHADWCGVCKRLMRETWVGSPKAAMPKKRLSVVKAMQNKGRGLKDVLSEPHRKLAVFDIPIKGGNAKDPDAMVAAMIDGFLSKIPKEIGVVKRSAVGAFPTMIMARYTENHLFLDMMTGYTSREQYTSELVARVSAMRVVKPPTRV